MNLAYFLQNIPKIKKLKMFHVSELLKYVCVVNSIEYSMIPSTPKKAKKIYWDYSTPKRKHIQDPVRLAYSSLKKPTVVKKICNRKMLFYCFLELFKP